MKLSLFIMLALLVFNEALVLGAPQDDDTKLEWIAGAKKAALAGDAEMAYKLYYHFSTHANKSEAMKWLKIAAEGGSPYAFHGIRQA